MPEPPGRYPKSEPDNLPQGGPTQATSLPETRHPVSGGVIVPWKLSIGKVCKTRSLIFGFDPDSMR
jgi:hypothetical protein